MGATYVVGALLMAIAFFFTFRRDRIDRRKGHCPENCRWATHSEQNKSRHYTGSFFEACRRNWLKAMAEQEAKRRR